MFPFKARPLYHLTLSQTHSPTDSWVKESR